MDLEEQFLTTAQAAKAVRPRVTRNAILRAINEKRLPATRMGKVWLIRRADLAGYHPLPATR